MDGNLRNVNIYAFLVFNPIMVEGYDALLSYLYVSGSVSITPVGEERVNLSAIVYL